MRTHFTRLQTLQVPALLRKVAAQQKGGIVGGRELEASAHPPYSSRWRRR